MKKLLAALTLIFAKIQMKSGNSKEPETCVPLRQLVNQAMIGLLPRNLQQKSFIVNDVEKEMFVNNDENILSKVIGRLLSTIIVHTNDNSIHVSANLSGNTTLLNIKTNDTRRLWTIANSVHRVHSMTEKIGGRIIVVSNEISGTTLAFTFRNQEAA